MKEKVINTQSIIEQCIKIVDKEVKRLAKKDQLERDEAFVLNDYIKTLSSVQKESKKSDKNQLVDATRLTNEDLDKAIKELKGEDDL